MRWPFCDALRSSEALPNEKALRNRDFPGFCESFFESSARRCEAGLASFGGSRWVGCAVSGEIGSAETGCDKGDGLVVRFVSSVFVAGFEAGFGDEAAGSAT